jgi:hypothetical protein
MIFQKKEIIENYTGREERFKNNKNYCEFMINYLKTEPHCLYNMGHFYNFIKNQKNFEKVLSIGIDPMKEYILHKECNFKQIDVYDIDINAVKEGNKFWKTQGDSANIKYYCKNIVVDEINNSYSTLLLFQMDYIFSDVEISNILHKSLQSGILNCYVITPSLFNINNLKPINIFIYDTLYFIFYAFQQLVLNIKNILTPPPNIKNLYFTYKRTKFHLIDLFKKYQYVVSKEKVINNNNGSFNYFHFRLEK